MSTVRALVLQDVTTNRKAAPHSMLRGVCKAWGTGNLHTAPASLAVGFNISSLTDIGIGHSRFTYATPLESGSGTTPVGMSSTFTVASGDSGLTYTNIVSYSQANAVTDSYHWFALHGDLSA